MGGGLAGEWQAQREGGAKGACAVGSAPRASQRNQAGLERPGRWRRWGGRAGAGQPGGRGGATLEPRVPLPWPPPAPRAAPSPPGRAPGPRTDGPWRRPPPASPCSPSPRSRWRPGPRPALVSAPDPVSERPPTPALRGISPRGPPWGPDPFATTLRDSFSKPLSDAPSGRPPASARFPQPLSDSPQAGAVSHLRTRDSPQAPQRRPRARWMPTRLRTGESFSDAP